MAPRPAILIIGAGPGIGQATAERFGREGWRVILASRDEARLAGQKAALEAQGVEASTIRLDAGDLAAVARTVEAVDAQSPGGLSVLHYNAAVVRAQSLFDMPLEAIGSDLLVGVGGAMAAIRTIVPRMEERGGGVVLLTGGGLGRRPMALLAALGAGKAALINLVDGLFDDLAGRGVHIASITVGAHVVPGAKEASDVADRLFDLYSEPREAWTREAVYP